MKSFSEQLATDREFEIGGETFLWRHPHWEQMAEMLDEDVAELDALTKDTNGSLPETKAEVKKLQERILVFIDPANTGHARFKKLTARKTDPVPIFLWGRLYNWLMEVCSGRPLPPPSGSEAGDGDTAVTSPDSSASGAATQTP